MAHEYHIPSRQYGSTDTDNIDELMNNISIDIKNLEKILNNVGTLKDTQDQRDEFNVIRSRIKSKIDRVTEKLSRSLTREAITASDSDTTQNELSLRSDLDTTKYSEQLQTYSHKIRDIAQNAIKKFRKHKVKQITINNNDHDERSPLLQGTTQRQSLQQRHEYGDIANKWKVIDDKQLLESKEEEVTQIHDDIKEMKEMFNQLDEFVNDTGVVVDKLETNIGVSMGDVVAGKDELEDAERVKRRSRNSKIMLLVVLIVVLAIIVAFVWAYDRTK